MKVVRRGAKVYAYESVRVGGRVVNRYVGSGPAVLLLAELGAAEAERRRAEREERRAVEKFAASIGGIVDDAREAAHEELERHGYHRPDRGDFRRRRDMADAPVVIDRTKLKGRVLGKIVASKLLDEIAGGDDAKTTREILQAEMKAVAMELAGADPDPISAMLAEAAAVAWFGLQVAQMRVSRLHTGEYVLAKDEHYQRQAERAQRRLTSALRTLAKVKSLRLAPAPPRRTILVDGVPVEAAVDEPTPLPKPEPAPVPPAPAREEALADRSTHTRYSDADPFD